MWYVKNYIKYGITILQYIIVLYKIVILNYINLLLVTSAFLRMWFMLLFSVYYNNQRGVLLLY